MTAITHAPSSNGNNTLRSTVEFLGGASLFKHRLGTALDAHEMLLHGLPGEALTHLVETLRVFRVTDEALEKAFGMSLRTFQRRKEAPAKPLNREQSGRTWKFAEILARATELFGSQEEAERWLGRPAMALNRHRPIDLLTTPAGVELVEDLLGRIEYGVYT